MIQWHEEVLTLKALRCAKALGEVLKGNFYLAGGTGLALRAGHRVSLDFDLFSEKMALTLSEQQRLVADFNHHGKINVRDSSEGACRLHLDGFAVSLFHYPFPLLRPPTDLWRALPVAHATDIAAMKLDAIIGRGSKKDFVDLYVLCQEIGFQKILEAGAERFPQYNDFVLQAARALVYFDDAEKEPMPKMLIKTTWEEIRRYFELQVPRLIRRLTGNKLGTHD